MSKKICLHTQNAPEAIGPYAQAIEAGGLVYTSGQIALVPETGALVEGGVEALDGLEAGSFDALILSNILDNLYPEDAAEVLAQAGRLLRPGGRALIKLNPWLSPEQVHAWNIRVVEGDLLDDGLLLWNNTTQRWRELIGTTLDIVDFETVYYPEFDQTNRLFLAEKE